MATTAGQFLQTRTGRLAGTYFAIIVALTLMFSIVLFSVMSLRLDRPTPPPGREMVPQEQAIFHARSEKIFHERIEATLRDLLVSIVLFNLAIYIGAGFFSYYLARKTLEPIEAAMERQVQFVSDASHELRTPLTAIQTANEVALRNRKLTLTESRRVMEQTIEDADKLHALASALLGLAREERVIKRAFSLQDAVTEAIQPVVPLALAKDIAIEETTSSARVLGHSASVTQIVRILLENAVKYSPEKSTITVTNESSGNHEVIRVKDHGVGVAEADRAKIFDRFYRADVSRSSQTVEGFGLGLAIARQLANTQGYGLRLEHTKQGEGSTFALSLPKAPTNERK